MTIMLRAHRDASIQRKVVRAFLLATRTRIAAYLSGTRHISRTEVAANNEAHF